MSIEIMAVTYYANGIVSMPYKVVQYIFFTIQTVF